MAAAGRHCGEAHDQTRRHLGRHQHWLQSLHRRPVAELATVIGAPAIRGARGRDPAGVEEAGRQCGEAHAACHLHRAQLAGRGPVAELAGTVGAPAVGGTCGRDPAGVIAPHAHREEAHARPGRHGHRGQLAGPAPVAELAVGVEAPAVGGTCGRDPAGVTSARAHRGKAHTRRSRHEHWSQFARRAPVAELPVSVVTPAVGGPRWCDSAGVTNARAHRREAHARGGHHEHRG